MSACNTFKGTLSKDGVLGLSRAFLAAGTRTLVASLWPLNDDVTSSFVMEFYSALFKGLSVASALKHAMVTMKGEGYGVEAWAPFILYGSDEVVHVM